MVKLFVGNLGDSYEVTSNDLRLQFERYGSVTECERIKNYAFVHMEDATAAEKALQELNGFVIKGKKFVLDCFVLIAEPRCPSMG